MSDENLSLSPSLVHRFAILLASAVLVTGPLCAALASPPATVIVDAGHVVGPVNRWVFGNNMLAYQRMGRSAAWADEYAQRGSGIWDPDTARPDPGYLALAKQAGISVARWPGGSEAHLYNWKRVVGPVAQRPYQKFGLSEFLEWCRAAGAEPLLTVAAYWGDADDAADLVEYLNSPVGANPDRGKDWAAVRASEGHPKPWHVTWFEYGNEVYDGPHGGRQRFTPEAYGRSYLAYRQAMKRVDPSIKLGVVMYTDDWNRRVLRTIGGSFDFLIIHTYIPGIWGEQGSAAWKPRQVEEACLAADVAMRDQYESVIKLARQITGRHDIPIAVTEFNGGFVQEKPVPYRQCLANALRNADNLRVMLDPSLGIAMACFWQYANEYWGMVRGWPNQGQKLVKQANYYVFQLYHQHFGDQLLETAVKCARWDFAGACGVPARRGLGRTYKLFPANLYKGEPWHIDQCDGARQWSEEGGAVVGVQFSGTKLNYYHATVTLPAEPSTGYRIVGSIKTDDLRASQGAGFQVGDSRGWIETQSASVFGDVKGTTGWTRVEGTYLTLPDTKGITITARRLETNDTVSGEAWFRIDSVQRFQPQVAPAVPYVEALASRRKADGTVCVMLIHKDLDHPTPVTIDVKGAKVGSAKAWALTGSSPLATNLGAKPEVGVRELKPRVAEGAVKLTLPPCSVVAVVIHP